MAAPQRFARRLAGPAALAAGAAVARLPAIIAKAEAALDDYDADKRSPRRRFNRFMVVAGFWLLVLVSLMLIWRLVG